MRRYWLSFFKFLCLDQDFRRGRELSLILLRIYFQLFSSFDSDGACDITDKVCVINNRVIVTFFI